MDFESIKQNFRFRSGRQTNMSKRFPTREREPVREVVEQQPERIVVPKKKMKGEKKVTMKPVDGKVSEGSPQSPAPKPTSKPPKGDIAEQPVQEPPKQAEGQKLSVSDSGEADYDLRPTSSKPRSESLESLTELLFSEAYLRTLTSDPQLLARFSSFLSHYEPSIAPLVLQYVETQKVVKAISYANAVAKTLPGNENAAELSKSFQDSAQHAFDTLLNTALPAWVTYNLVKTSTSILIAEITNQSTPLTRDLVGGLSEVFCITDPNVEDNPIVYASEEFYRLTGYGRDSVIGFNCRFLQGGKTRRESVRRLKEAIGRGEEICETLLNYRRDGRPFVNVLMLAPLHDDRGNVKYYLGAQVDASRLVEGGRGVEGLERCLVRKEMEEKRNIEGDREPKQIVLEKLRDLSMAFDLEESAVVQSQSRRNSISKDEEPFTKGRAARRRLEYDGENLASEDDDFGDEEKHTLPEWTISQNKPTGKLPGIYKKYLLVRPYPSLRAIFVSQSARRLGKLQQKPLLSYLAAPASTLAGLKECFQSGTPVTGKVAIMKQAGVKREGTVTGKWNARENNPSTHGEICWISATPMLDGNDGVGVWMVVIVDKNSASSNTGRRIERLKNLQDSTPELLRGNGDVPIKPKLVGGGEQDEQQGAEMKDEGSSTMVLSPRTPDQSQRSEDNVPPSEAEDTDAMRIESRNGSVALNHDSAEPRALVNGAFPEISDGDEDEQDPLTPPTKDQEEDSISSDTTPRQNGLSGSRRTDVGLRAMDYLSSRSMKVDGQDGDGGVDWNVASPYSVD